VSNTDEPLEPDLANILEQAKPLDRVPPGASERILDGLAARLAAASSGGRGASHPASGARLLSRPVVVGLASFVAGAAVGAVLRQPPRRSSGSST
jgi:hypothetical protein